MKIIGLNHGEFNSSAALCVNSKILAGAAEERFTRQKKTKAFPTNALNFCLSFNSQLTLMKPQHVIYGLYVSFTDD